MAEAVDQARQERELTKAALAADLDRLEDRVRAELDWRARLRRDAPRLILAGTALVVVAAGGLILRRVLGGGKPKPGTRQAPSVRSLDDVASELAKLRDELDGRRAGQPVWQKVVLKATTAAGAAAGTLVARQLMARFAAGTGEGHDAEEAGGPSSEWE